MRVSSERGHLDLHSAARLCRLLVQRVLAVVLSRCPAGSRRGEYPCSWGGGAWRRRPVVSGSTALPAGKGPE